MPRYRVVSFQSIDLFRGSLKGLEISADLGAGPVLGTDEFAADDALAVDDVGLGPLLGVIKPGGAVAGVADGDQVHVAVVEEAFVFVFILVDADGENGQIGAVVVELDKPRHFLNAGGALRPPEVEQYDLSAVAGQMDGCGSVSDGEIGGDPASLGWMGAAIAGGDEGHRQEQGE